MVVVHYCWHVEQWLVQPLLWQPPLLLPLKAVGGAPLLQPNHCGHGGATQLLWPMKVVGGAPLMIMAAKSLGQEGCNHYGHPPLQYLDMVMVMGAPLLSANKGWATAVRQPLWKGWWCPPLFLSGCAL
jgi:hypothetical protein